MSCLKIGFPHLRPIINLSDVDDTQINNKCGLASGFRHNLIYSKYAVSSWYVDFDYGSMFTPDYLYIAKLSLTDNITAIGIEASVDNITYTGVWSTTSINLQGNNDQDYFINLNTIGTARYWRVSFSASPASIFKLSKLYLGSLFTFDKTISPSTKQRFEARDKNRFISTSNRLYNARSTKRLNAWDIVINHLSTQNIAEFLRNIVDIEKRYVVLYDSSESEYFNHQQVWHGIISNVAFETIQNNLHNLTFTFKEMA